MTAGHLQEKNNLYYVVLNYADTQGKRKSKWISTGLFVKGSTIVIRHTVTTCTLDGKKLTISKNRTKNVSSLVLLPLVPVFREKQQGRNRKLFRKSYCTDYLDYIYVDKLGERIQPNYITGAFPKLLKQHDMWVIRFHDLRCSCTSLLLAAGVPMKAIQEWLGHSTCFTTADIYAHLAYKSKVQSADAMENILHIEKSPSAQRAGSDF